MFSEARQQYPFQVEGAQQNIEHTKRIFDQIRRTVEEERKASQAAAAEKRLKAPIFSRVWVSYGSDRDSHKFKRFAEDIGATPSTLNYVKNEYFDEDADKPLIKELLDGKPLEDPMLTAILKAEQLFSDDPQKRAAQLAEMCRQGIIPREKINSPLLLFAANDIVLTLTDTEGKQEPIVLLKPNFGEFPDRPANATKEEIRARKTKVLNHYVELYRKLPRYARLDATGAMAIMDGITNTGVAAEATWTLFTQQPKPDMLETLVFGITEHTPPHIAKLFIEVNAFAEKDKDGKEYWTPEDGFNEDWIKKVNGGFLGQHPLFHLVFATDHEGNPVTPEHFKNTKYNASIESYKNVALGNLVRKEMILALLSRVEQKVFGRATEPYDCQELSPKQQQILEKLAAGAIYTSADWVKLPPQSPDLPETLIHQNVQRLMSQAVVFDAAQLSRLGNV